jgi:hypothetical protein
MVATLLRLVGINVRRLAREAATTIVLAMLGAFTAMLALTCGFVALYLCLELKLGTIAALGILGGTSALMAGVLFAIAFLHGSRKPSARAEDDLRAVAQTAEGALNGAADIVRNGSRQQVAGTVAVALLIGWVLGRRF